MTLVTSDGFRNLSRDGDRLQAAGGQVIRLRLLLCTALLACGVTSASGTMRIVEDHGGQVGKYLQAFAAWAGLARAPSWADKQSPSIITRSPVERTLEICVTPRARFGFHAASMPNNDGRLVTSALATQALWGIYPASVRRWIIQHAVWPARWSIWKAAPLMGS
jgi:hypothetical protein